MDTIKLLILKKITNYYIWVPLNPSNKQLMKFNDKRTSSTSVNKSNSDSDEQDVGITDIQLNQNLKNLIQKS